MLAVVIRSSRIGMALLLALLVPAGLTSAWAWLVHGGVITNAEVSERTDVTRCMDTAARVLTEDLTNAASKAAIRLTLDSERHCVGPFAGGEAQGATARGSLAPIGIAEQAARARHAANDEEGALPFYALANERSLLTPEGTLIYASLLRKRDVGEATKLLSNAEHSFGESWCGPLPFKLLLALHRAHAGVDVDSNLALILATAPNVAATAIPAVIAEMLVAVPSLRGDERIEQLAAAAFASQQLAGTPAANHVTTLANGVVTVPITETSVAALPASTIASLLAKANRRAAAEHPEFALTMPDVRRATWRTQRVTMATSTMLTYVARTCLALAVATLVVGNLLLWRLSRRELALVRMRRDFVDVVSHELRTPLTALSLKVEMLANGDVPQPRQQHYLQTLHGDVHRLSDQVERILDFGRLERGAPLHRELIATRSVLARGLRAGLPALRMVQQNVEVEVPRSLPPLQADVSVLTRALRNLLENAAKYAPAGSTVAVRAFANGNRITVEVADTGPGVSMEERQAIFQPFVRACTATPGIQGSGLGLALVAAAAKAHGGSVDVRDRNGGGAVFTLHLPIAKENAS